MEFGGALERAKYDGYNTIRGFMSVRGGTSAGAGTGAVTGAGTGAVTGAGAGVGTSTGAGTVVPLAQ